ncbi:MAG TPA: hypothetical protein VFS59_16020 [Gemmatimonadaceae bacterium]|nr:hypothetical protein [Gemmatimonadaceae bacterium]
MILAVPATPPVTVTLCPVVADRLATLASLVVHVTVLPVSVVPPASFVVASIVLVLFCTIDVLLGETVIDATGTAVTVTAAVPL